jgi:hypothetical protein
MQRQLRSLDTRQLSSDFEDGKVAESEFIESWDRIEKFYADALPASDAKTQLLAHLC